ncbi:hypothetical protein FE257_000293 [Aspergillus nanangensis]|uniref:PXA domain-containing protein n=1 Tax=Aspergillus nanangensis TaxID=2582783 RepID=A0AAD4CZL2_ASPNN|nr:hypothetical protein FE257_000293 [Aspergillus nanangensis]
MNTDPSRPGLQPFSHLKAGPTTSSSKSTARPGSLNLQVPSQKSQRPRLSKYSSRDEQVDPISDRATVALIRRVLCAPTATSHGSTPSTQSLEDLPPLTSSNDVDLQLYALIAIIIKEFVLSWYSNITADQALIDEALQVIAHCTRALEQRLRATDVAQLILDEVPALIEAHIFWYRHARELAETSGVSSSTREIYHTLNPHPGLSPIPDPADSKTVDQQLENESTYRQMLVQAVLAVLLPTEDLENVCLRTLVGDIMADLILGNEVSGSVCEGWFLWNSVIKLIEKTGKPADEADGSANPIHKRSQLQKFGLLSSKEESKRQKMSKAHLLISNWVWSTLQLAYLIYVTLRFIVEGLFRAASRPVGSASISTTPIGDASETSAYGKSSGKRPVLQFRAYGMASQLLDVPRRMPWLVGQLALFQHWVVAGPGRLGDTGSVLDRFLRETIEHYVLVPTLFPNLLLASRAALFPLNARPPAAGASRPPQSQSVQPPASPTERGHPPSDATGANTASSSVSTSISSKTTPSLSPNQSTSAPDIASIKRQCAAAILSLVPRPVARRFFGLTSTNATPYAPDRQAHLRPLSKRGDHSVHPPQPAPKASRASSPVSSSNGDQEELLLMAAIEHDILDLFADSYCNKHLIYSIIEVILARLLPEMSERCLTELIEDRGVSLAANG